MFALGSLFQLLTFELVFPYETYISTHTTSPSCGCTADTDDCASAPCLNSGACTDGGASVYTCKCENTGYVGYHCETDIDECSDPDACDSKAACANTAGSYNCVCNDGYSGDGKTCDGMCFGFKRVGYTLLMFVNYF